MTINYFENLLNLTFKRLEKKRTEWEKFLDEDYDAPEDAFCEIMSIIGKISILLEHKLPQYRSMLDELPRGQYGQYTVGNQDLQGFWDLISLEVHDVDEMIQNIESRRAHNWAPIWIIQSWNANKEVKNDGTDKPEYTEAK